MLAQDLRNTLQHLVAAFVTVQIINNLKFINIKNYQGRTSVQFRQFLREHFTHPVKVVGASQIIHKCRGKQLAVAVCPHMQDVKNERKENSKYRRK